eukprot:UN10651
MLGVQDILNMVNNNMTEPPKMKIDTYNNRGKMPTTLVHPPPQPPISTLLNSTTTDSSPLPTKP